MTKKTVIGIKTGYYGGGPTGAGDQWAYGKKIEIGGVNRTDKRNGGLFATYSEAKADSNNQGEFWYHMIYPKIASESIPVYWKIKHPDGKQPKLPAHFEDGKNKYFTVGADRSGWMYQTKNITTWSHVLNYKDKILFFEINGQKNNLYSFCWTSFNDPNTDEYFLDRSVNGNRKENSWFSTIACAAENSSTNIAQAERVSTQRSATSSRLRNVVGFSVNTMFNGDGYNGNDGKDAGIYPLTICLIMQKPGSSKNYLMMARTKNTNSIEINQRIDTADSWGNGRYDSIIAGTLKGEKGTLHTISYYCSQEQIDTIVRDKLEFIGVWWKMGRMGQGGPSTHSKGAIAFWNFRPFVVGPSGALSATWNSKTYNILGKPRDDYTSNRAIALL